MQEQQLYSKDGLFHNIIKASVIMAGRYTVLPNGSRDLDTNNALTGIELPQAKYPMVACLPPVSAIDPKKQQFEYLTFRLLFLCTSGQSGDGQFKNRDAGTNTSQHSVALDWNDMKEIAFQFVSAIDELERSLRDCFIDANSPLRIHRISNAQRDNVSGVMLQFTMALASGCATTDIDVSKIQLPNIIHENHFH